MKRASVLIVDDEATLNKNACTYLRRAGYPAAGATTAEEGLRCFHALQPSVVITDFNLPGMDGFELLQRLRHVSPGTKVVMMSSECSEQRADAAFAAGASHYLCKPLALSTLKALIDDLLEDPE